MDKWQSLGNKEGTETERLRKERITLEVKFRELESRLSESEHHLAEEVKFRDVKLERFRSRLHEYVVRFQFLPLFSTRPPRLKRFSFL